MLSSKQNTKIDKLLHLQNDKCRSKNSQNDKEHARKGNFWLSIGQEEFRIGSQDTGTVAEVGLS